MNSTKQLSRRRMLKGSSATLAALGLLRTMGFGKPVSAHASHTEITMNEETMTQDIQQPAPKGPGSVSGAPHLPAGFTDTFTSHSIKTGDVRLHAVIGGDGPPLLLIHGWPQTWYAWRMIMPTLARDFQVIAVDQRGRGLSDKPRSGYDTGTLANDLVGLMDALGHQRFALYGTDTGMPIAYALAADHPERVARLVVSEAPLPGVAPSPPLFVPAPINERYYHIAFNRTATVNEQLVKGREDIFFGNEFEIFAVKKLPDYAVKYYIDQIAHDPEALSANFNWYRALDATMAQNEQRKTRRLTMPVLAIGGEKSAGAGVANTMKLAADDVQSAVIPGSGHWVAEEAPEELLAALTAFLAPYREAAAANVTKPAVITPNTGPAGMTFAVAAKGFQAKEQVVTWLNTPASVQGLQLSGTASAGGSIQLEFDSAGLAPGYYGLVLHGLDSRREYVLPFGLTG